MTGHRKAGLLLGALLIAAPAAAPPIGSGAPATEQPDEDENLQYSAAVSQVHSLTHQGNLSPTLFSTVGGDPAINGVYLFLSFDISPAEGARIFRIGDVSDYRVLSETPGRLLLAVTEDGLRNGGDVYQMRRRVLVTWTPGPDGTPPGAVTVRTAPSAPAPARRR